MFKAKRVSVVIPAHNEEHAVARVISGIPSFVDNIVVVDDGSTDQTVLRVRSVGRTNVEILISPTNVGVGGAMVLGYRHCLKAHPDIVVKMDGDGQMDPESMTDLLDAVIEGNADYAKGNRFMSEGLGNMPFHRILANVLMTFLTKAASGYWHVFDPQNGYTAIRAKTLARLNLSHLHTGFFFENDMLVHLNFLRSRVIDVSIPAVYGNEISHINPWKIMFTFPSLLLRRFVSRFFHHYVLRDFSPIALYVLCGGPLFVGGIGFGSFIWLKGVKSGVLTPPGTIALAGLPIILGFQLLLQATALDMANTPK